MKNLNLMLLIGAAIFTLSNYSFAKQEPPHLSKKTNYIKVDTSLLATKQDVVCRMNVKNKMVDTIMYHKKVYGFCGTGCKKAFVKSPATYVKK